jgi:hypothetical protein
MSCRAPRRQAAAMNQAGRSSATAGDLGPAARGVPSKSRPLRRIYIDAFAGSRNRELDELHLWKNNRDMAKSAQGFARIALRE